MMPDLFSKEIVTFYINNFNHDINYSKHTESLTIIAEPSYDSDFDDDEKDDYEYDPEPREEVTFYILKDVPQDYIWMSLLDYDPEDTPGTLDAFAYVEKAFACLSFLDLSKKEHITESPTLYHIPFDAAVLNNFDDLSSDILNLLKQAMDMKPALGYILPYFLITLHQLWNHTHRIKPGESVAYFSDTSFSTLTKEILSFRDYYSQAREALYSIFMLPEKIGLPVASDEAAGLYKVYAALHKIPLFNTHRTGEDPSHGEPDSWQDFLIGNYGIPVDGIIGYAFPSFKKFVMDAIDSMSSSNAVLRKCALCGGYFKTKRGAKQTCCSRLYRDTKTTCYEYASRKQYQEKLKEHPIYQEYIKAYNRLYGRIRRKAIPTNTPLAERLKELRDEYYEKYDNASPSARKGILQEFIKRNNEILS